MNKKGILCIQEIVDRVRDEDRNEGWGKENDKL